MPTPTFAATSGSFTSVRYYTASDPYYYTIDNRPLTDLQTNATSGSIGADAGRRAALIGAMDTAIRNQLRAGITTDYVDGFIVDTTSNPGYARIHAGVYMQLGDISASDTRKLVRGAIAPYYTDLAINTVNLTGGQGVLYAIEAKVVDFSGSTANTFPGYDNTNSLLPSSLLNAQLQLQVVAGAAATAGSEVAPSLTSGWFQLYLIQVTAASGVVNIYYPNSATFKSWGMGPTYLDLANSTSTSATNGETPVTRFTTTQVAFSSIPLPSSGPVRIINPYKPIRFRTLYATSVNTGVATLQLKYQFLPAATNLASASLTTVSADLLAASGTANYLAAATLNATIPAYASLTAERLHLNISRPSSGDTAGGNLDVVSIQAYQ